MQKAMIFDGLKSVPVFGLDSDRGWTILAGDETHQEGPALYYKRVPWLFRGVRDRANNVSKMPWFIVKNKTDFDDFANYENNIEFLPNPRRLISQMEQSIAMTGKAFAFLETNSSGYIKSIKYCKPTSIEEITDNDTGEITGYRRTLKGHTLTVQKENIVAIYDADYLTEEGPAKVSAAEAALLAAGVMFNTAGFVSTFFRRGAIKATVLTAMNTSQPEAERLQTWWDDVVAGVKNAWSAIVLRSENVKSTVIGEGLESLQNDSLTATQRQEIATALGVPESRMWSAAANYATRQMDDKAYYESTIIPECDMIAEAFNDQVFTQEHNLKGYRLEARYETLDIFQVDSREQATAYGSYVGNGMKPSIAAQVLGIELPAGIDYKDLDPEPQPAALVTANDPPTDEKKPPAEDDKEPPANPQEMRSVLSAWKRKAELSLKKNNTANCDFVTTIIPAAQQEAIRAALAGCTLPAQVKQVFEQVAIEPQAEDNKANELMERALNVLEEIHGG
jgi:HK97 family phage portal protein